MTQLTQFIKWQFRDFGRMFKSISATTVFVVLLGGQCGSILVSLVHNDRAALELLSLTIPLTVMMYVLVLVCEIQWDRFKRDQNQVIDTLKK